jgi:hypothetical protein
VYVCALNITLCIFPPYLFHILNVFYIYRIQYVNESKSIQLHENDDAKQLKAICKYKHLKKKKSFPSRAFDSWNFQTKRKTLEKRISRLRAAYLIPISRVVFALYSFAHDLTWGCSSCGICGEKKVCSSWDTI